MKKALIIMLVVAASMVFVASIFADQSGTVPANAKIQGETMTITAKAFVGDGIAANVEFGNISPSTEFAVPDQYIEISYANNTSATGWGIILTTNNTGFSGPADAYRGGLLGSKRTNEYIPLAWQARKDKPAAYPAFSAAELGLEHWKFVSDQHDPGVTYPGSIDKIVQGAANGDAWIQGYPNGGDLFEGPVKLFLGGKFNGKLDTYSTTLVFDLYNW